MASTGTNFRPARAGPLLTSGGTAAVEGAAPRLRILLVDDSEDLCEALGGLLEDLGHEVAIAVTGLEGVDKLLALQPDVAFVDVGLPGIDGYEVARRVRAQPGGDKPYLVALTGYGGAEASEKAKSAGFDRHLTKPISIHELPQVLIEATRKS